MVAPQAVLAVDDSHVIIAKNSMAKAFYTTVNIHCPTQGPSQLHSVIGLDSPSFGPVCRAVSQSQVPISTAAADTEGKFFFS